MDRRDLLAAAATLGLARLSSVVAVPCSKSAQEYVPLIDCLSDLVLPGSARQNPGAYLAALPDFAFRDMTGAHVALVEAFLARSAGGDFVFCGPERRRQALDLLEHVAFDTTATGAASELGKAWKAMKMALMSLYYTTEQGASVDLRYEIVPGRWEPDIPVSREPRAPSNDYLAESYT